MNVNFSTWSSELAVAIEDQVDTFAVDCHPWNGIIALAILTQSEINNDPLLYQLCEMASWRYYNFGASLESWQQTSDLALQMKIDYERAGENRALIAEGYLHACSSAVASNVVQAALSTIDRTDSLRISVAHPDSGLELYKKL